MANSSVAEDWTAAPERRDEGDRAPLRDELRVSGLAESSIGSVLVVLRSVLAYARHADYTTADPFRGIRRGELPSPSESSKRSVCFERMRSGD